MTDFQLTPEDQKSVGKAEKIFREAKHGPPMPENLLRKMQDQAETSAALRGKPREVIEEDIFDEFLGEDEEKGAAP